MTKELYWLGSSKKDLKKFPLEIKQAMGYGLYLAQQGCRHLHAKTLSGFGSANIIEIRETDSDGTYRVIYTLELQNYIFVLHAFQKKSKAGISTPKKDMDLVKLRLLDAKALFKELGEK